MIIPIEHRALYGRTLSNHLQRLATFHQALILTFGKQRILSRNCTSPDLCPALEGLQRGHV